MHNTTIRIKKSIHLGSHNTFDNNKNFNKKGDKPNIKQLNGRSTYKWNSNIFTKTRWHYVFRYFDKINYEKNFR